MDQLKISDPGQFLTGATCSDELADQSGHKHQRRSQGSPGAVLPIDYLGINPTKFNHREEARRLITSHVSLILGGPLFKLLYLNLNPGF